MKKRKFARVCAHVRDKRLWEMVKKLLNKKVWHKFQGLCAREQKKKRGVDLLFIEKIELRSTLVRYVEAPHGKL